MHSEFLFGYRSTLGETLTSVFVLCLNLRLIVQDMLCLELELPQRRLRIGPCTCKPSLF